MSSHQMRDASHDNKEVRDSFEELIIVEETSIVHDRPVDETSTFKFRDWINHVTIILNQTLFIRRNTQRR